MNEKQLPANNRQGGRKGYQTLKLVNHGHFLDVVKASAVKDGSQIVDTELPESE